MEAEISGSQRKVVTSSVRPAKRVHGDSGIALRSGKTLPFVVERGWSAPAGVYPEWWLLIDPSTRDVMHASPVRETAIWGLQGLTRLSDEVRTPLELRPGTYLVVFSLGGSVGGEVEVVVREAPAEEAA